MTVATPVTIPLKNIQFNPGSLITIRDVTWEQFEAILEEREAEGIRRKVVTVQLAPDKRLLPFPTFRLASKRWYLKLLPILRVSGRAPDGSSRRGKMCSETCELIFAGRSPASCKLNKVFDSLSRLPLC
ncbi:hypothetical protein [Microseira sp. BLCC-F43]|jgi:hypothetical protein|uniref:hypothetical protein n=1 Tax=Microseira sp. BLCC-F43 TaxID=3153602 RepID=UPI0035B94CE8